MSAPPIGITASTPKTSDNAITPYNHCDVHPGISSSATPQATTATSTNTVMNRCPGKGPLPLGIVSESFAHATRLPENVIPPIKTEIRIVIEVNVDASSP